MKRQMTFSVSFGAAILVAGVLGMFILFQFREPPAEASTGIEERMLDVRVTVAEPIDHTVTVEGFGATRARTEVTISPEVSGRVIYANPKARVGEHVSEGELLLTLDGERYASLVAEREAQAGQLEAELERLRIAQENDRGRVGALERSSNLTKTQFERAKMLLAEGVGNQLDVDRSEQTYNEALDRVRQLQSVLNTYPAAIQEAEQRLAAARAGLDRARLDLARTEIVAPFSGRIDSVLIAAATTANGSNAPAVAVGHFAEAGRPLLVLSDDSALEIPIKLDARDAHDWLVTTSDAHSGHAVVPVECTVTWSETDTALTWVGMLDRIEQYDAETRTMTAVVTVDRSAQTPGQFPLSKGMFCGVRVPGKTLEDVIAVPQAAISVDGEVYVVENGRLVSRRVEPARIEGSLAYIATGIAPGEQVITTRLINPIENSLVRVAEGSQAVESD